MDVSMRLVSIDALGYLFVAFVEFQAVLQNLLIGEGGLRQLFCQLHILLR